MPISAGRHSPPELAIVDEPPSRACDLDQGASLGDLQPQQPPPEVVRRLTPTELAAEYRRWIVGVSPSRR